MADIKINYVDIDKLKPSEYNPRKWNNKMLDDIKNSISTFGIIDPIIVNCNPNRMNVVIGGHLRLYASKQMNIKQVPVVYLDINDINKEQELNIRLNKNQGEFDYELLANISEEILKNSGFTDEELKKMFSLEEENKICQYPEMEIQPFEHYDYIVVMCRSSMDFINLCEKLNIHKVNASLSNKIDKVGIARVIEASKLIDKLK